MIRFRSPVHASLLVLLVFPLLQACEGGTRLAQTSDDTVYAEPAPPAAPSATDGLPPAFDREATYSRELHVAPNGSDETGDGSPGAPFASPARALGEAGPGTRIHLAPGTYAPIGSITNLQGEPQAPIAISGQGNAIIDGRLTDEVISGLHLSNPRYVVVEGLQIRHTYPHGVSIDDGGDYATPAGPVILRGLHIRDVGRGRNNDCMKMSGVDHFQILDSEFANCDQGEAIDMVGCHHGFLSGNTFRRTPLTAVQTKGGSSDIVIHANRFIEVTARSVNLGGHTGTPYFRPIDAPYEAARIRVLSNVFYRSGDTAIAFTGCIECVAAQNTIIDPQGHVVRLLEEHPERAIGRDSRFINNLIAFRAGEVRGLVTPGRHTRPETFALGWNLWHARDRGHYEGPHHDRRFPAEQSRAPGIDPAFLDPAAGNYRPGPDSPARRAGARLTGHGLPDYHGRTYRSPPTIGALETP